MMERIDLSFLRKNNTLAKPVESEVKDIKPKQNEYKPKDREWVYYYWPRNI